MSTATTNPTTLNAKFQTALPRITTSTGRIIRALSDSSGNSANAPNTDFADSRIDAPEKVEFVAPVAVPPSTDYNTETTSPIQVWEGTVLSVDETDGVVYARLTSRMGLMPDHNVSLSREWIHEQDEDLVVPGAVFYLMLFKKSKKGSIENGQEIRFRRCPNWSNDAINRVQTEASRLIARLRI